MRVAWVIALLLLLAPFALGQSDAEPESESPSATSPKDVPPPAGASEDGEPPAAPPDDGEPSTAAPEEEKPAAAQSEEDEPPAPLGREADAAIPLDAAKQKRAEEAAARSPEAAAREQRKEVETEKRRRVVAPDELTLQLRRTDTGFSGLFKYGPISVLSEASQKLNDDLEDAIGLRLGVAYTVLWQQATDSIGDGPRGAVGGDFDFFGRWRLIDTDTTTGQIGFLLENRHSFTDIPPAQLNQSIGSLWRTTRGFSKFDFTFRELWWDQSLFAGRLHYRIGTINQKHFIDLYRFKSQNFEFLSSPFSDSPTIAFPRNGFGAMLQFSPFERLHVTGTIGDANGQNVGSPSQFFSAGEFFTSLDVAATPVFEGFGEGRYSFTLWRIDEREEANIPDGHGFSLLAEQEVVKNVFPFFRYGYGTGADLKIEHLIVAGVGIQKPFGQPSDSFGVGVSWGRPSSDALRDQWGAEIYYRLQLTRAIQITPGFQVIVNPSANPRDDVIGVFQLRARVDF